jgi:hypothetical protein
MFDVPRCAHLLLWDCSTHLSGAIRFVDVILQEVLPIDTVYRINYGHPRPSSSPSIEHFLSLISFRVASEFMPAEAFSGKCFRMGIRFTVSQPC